MDYFIKIVQKVAPQFSRDELQTPFRELGIDSLDLVAIRVEIDKNIGHEIPETKWYEFETFQDVIAHIGTQEGLPPQNVETIQHTIKRDFEIGMPQMANSALSENWLFKETGDIHWNLLCKGLNSPSGSMADENGNRLYATFTRIQMDCPQLLNFKENHQLSITGTINRFGTLTYISKMEGKSGEHLIVATLMSSFTKRGGTDNLELIKGQPNVSKNTIGELDATPGFFNEYRLMRKGLMTAYVLSDALFDVECAPEFDTIYEPNPYYDVNGVGLIYFAAYPIISDFCEAKYFNNLDNQKNWETHFKTISRDIFYYANCNATDKIVYRLNQWGFYSDDKVKISSSLFRQSDGATMATIFTLKQRQE